MHPQKNGQHNRYVLSEAKLSCYDQILVCTCAFEELLASVLCVKPKNLQSHMPMLKKALLKIVHSLQSQITHKNAHLCEVGARLRRVGGVGYADRNATVCERIRKREQRKGSVEEVNKRKVVLKVCVQSYHAQHL